MIKAYFITYEEHHPNRANPLIANTITQAHPIDWLIYYRKHYEYDVNILFWKEIEITTELFQRYDDFFA